MNPSESQPVQQPALTELAELARSQAAGVLRKLPMLGAVSWLMLQQAATRNGLLNELEWRVLPALMFDQAKLYLRGDAPVAYASWAFLSDEVAERYKAAPHRLSMQDWKSGDQAWLIDVFAPYGGARDILKDVREKVLGGREVLQLVPVSARDAQIVRWPAANQA